VDVWVDASVLIALDTIGEVDFLRKAVGNVAVTRQVAEEILTVRASEALRRAVGAWIQVKAVRGDARRFRVLGLGKGEASLFLAPRGDVLVLDDRAARRLAAAEGRSHTGLLGLLREAARSGVITRTQARGLLDRLARTGFRMSANLQHGLLAEWE
jgi:predicted nucleic acid-binding protein